MNSSRRDMLQAVLASTLGLGLRSLVTGIPPAILLSPRKASASMRRDVAVSPKFVIYSTSGEGDPLNCNVPGTYDDPSIVHAKDPNMAGVPITQNGMARTGAKVWTGLPAPMLDKTVFFHHATYTIIHTEVGSVMRLQGAVNHNNMLPCALAATLSPTLGTVMTEPMCLYSDLNAALVDNGIPLPMHPPVSLKNVIGIPQGILGSAQLMTLRDKSMDALNNYAKSRGKEFRRKFLDQYALSQNEARSIQERLGKTLDNIKDNSEESQINLAIALFQLNMTSVASINIHFGGDNHYDGAGDGQFTASEVPGHLTGVASLTKMYEQINAAGLTDKVSFLMTNVFGRSLTEASGAKEGRGHNDSHAVSVMYGPNIKGGVVGGIGKPGSGGDLRAMAINSRTGAADAGGDISFSDTLASMGKTFAASVGGQTDGVNFRAGTQIPSIYA